MKLVRAILSFHAKRLTLSKSFRLFGDYPVASLNVCQLKQWEEFANDWKSLIRNIIALSAPDKQGRFLKTRVFRILERKVA